MFVRHSLEYSSVYCYHAAGGAVVRTENSSLKRTCLVRTFLSSFVTLGKCVHSTLLQFI